MGVQRRGQRGALHGWSRLLGLSVVGASACVAAQAVDDGAPLPFPPPPGALDGGLDAPVVSPETGLAADYFDRYSRRVVSRVDPQVEFKWDKPNEGPVEGVHQDHFSVRWEGELIPETTDDYTFVVTCDDGVRLWVNGDLVVEAWDTQPSAERQGRARLEAGKPVPIKLEYFQNGESAGIALSWSTKVKGKELIPSQRLRPRRRGPSRADTASPAPKPLFRNPLVAADCPSPSVVPASTPETPFWMACSGGAFPLRRTDDLGLWQEATGTILDPRTEKAPWSPKGDRNEAAEIHRVGDGYVAYFSAINAKNVLAIGTAVATSPLGPYTVSEAPLVEELSGATDAHLFQDGDGSRFLFWKAEGNGADQGSTLRVRRMASDGIHFEMGSAPVDVLQGNVGGWEGNEPGAPAVFRHQGYVYLFYGTGPKDERGRVGVARASGPLGPFERRGAPLLVNNDYWVGPNQPSVVPGGNGQSWLVYAAWPTNGQAQRTKDVGPKPMLDTLTFASGWPQVGHGTPSFAPQPWPTP